MWIGRCGMKRNDTMGKGARKSCEALIKWKVKLIGVKCSPSRSPLLIGVVMITSKSLPTLTRSLTTAKRSKYLTSILHDKMTFTQLAVHPTHSSCLPTMISRGTHNRSIPHSTTPEERTGLFVAMVHPHHLHLCNCLTDILDTMRGKHGSPVTMH